MLLKHNFADNLHYCIESDALKAVFASILMVNIVVEDFVGHTDDNDHLSDLKYLNFFRLGLFELFGFAHIVVFHNFFAEVNTVLFLNLLQLFSFTINKDF